MERDTKHFMISVGFGDDGWSLACNKRRLCQSFMSSRISINEIKSVDWDKAAAISNRFKDYEWYMPIIYQKSGYKGGEWNFSYPKFLKDSKRQTACKSMKANVWHLLLSCCICSVNFYSFPIPIQSREDWKTAILLLQEMVNTLLGILLLAGFTSITWSKMSM